MSHGPPSCDLTAGCRSHHRRRRRRGPSIGASLNHDPFDTARIFIYLLDHDSSVASETIAACLASRVENIATMTVSAIKG